MSLPRFNENVENISELADRPNDTNGLTAAELKALFDKAGGDIKNYLNNTLLPALESDGASGVGITEIMGMNSDNVQDALTELKDTIEEVRNLATSGSSGPSVYVTGGTFEYRETINQQGRIDWEIALLSGTAAKIAFTRNIDSVDVFLVSGGGNATGGEYGRTVFGGRGGRGGGTYTARNHRVSLNTPYSFSVGRAGNATSIFGYTAQVSGALGGVGASASYNSSTSSYDTTEAGSGVDGVYPFGENTSLVFPDRKFGASGGGGGVYAQMNVTHEGGYSETIIAQKEGAAGGVTGAGNGGTNSARDGADAIENTGAGGGGRFYVQGSNSTVNGNGGSGIIIIRNARG